MTKLTDTRAALLSKLGEFEPEPRLATDENGDEFDITSDPYLKALVKNGEYFAMEEGNQAVVCDNPPGHCHKSVAYILTHCAEDSDELYTGYARHFYNDEWFTHSFIVNNGNIVEPGSELFPAYFGVRLTGNARKAFIGAWTSGQST